MQRYTTQLSIGGRRTKNKMENKSEKPTSDNETPEEENTQQSENGLEDTKGPREFLVCVNNEMKKWPLEKDDEKKYLEQFNGISAKDRQKYFDFFKLADTDNLGCLDTRHFYKALHASGIHLPVRCISVSFDSYFLFFCYRPFFMLYI